MTRTAAIRRAVLLEDGQTVLAGENLIIRPISDHVGFIQLDDLKPEQLDHVRPAAFIIHATSPGNYQAWIAVSGLPEGKAQFKEFMRRVRNAVGRTDKSASHATRLAGTENFKTKYLPEFPTVTILETHPGRVDTGAAGGNGTGSGSRSGDQRPGSNGQNTAGQGQPTVRDACQGMA
jgi:hypothetical protein